MLAVGLRSPLLCGWKTCVVKTSAVLFFHCELNSMFERLKTKENFKLLALKVVAVAYGRWPLTRGSKYSDLTWKLFVILEK